MTDDARAGRIREIFRVLQNQDPRTGLGERIGLCREALGLMNPEEIASPAGGWLEFEAGKAYLRRNGPERFADRTAAMAAFTAALRIWTPRTSGRTGSLRRSI